MYRGLMVGVAIFLAIGAWWYFGVLPAAEDSTIEAPQQEEMSADSESQWQWQFDAAGETDQGVPKTTVTLRNGSTSYAIGTMEGNCYDISESEWELLSEEGEIAGAICWFAGGGTEIGVFSDGGRALIRLGVLEEATAESEGIRGEFQTLFAIDFGFIRRVDTENNTVLFDNALWLTGTPGEDAAIEAGLCTEETREECLPNDYYIYNADADSVSIPLASNITIYMLTWNAGAAGIRRQFIRPEEFAALINDESQHWSQLPYNVSIKNNDVIMIEEVYVP